MTRLSVVYAWVLVVLTAAPGAGMAVGVEREGYPFSTYPMFSSPRPRLEKRAYVVAVDGAGGEAIVPSHYWKKGHFNEGAAAIRNVAGDRMAERALCESVATKLGESRSDRYRDVARVELRSARFDRDEVFGDGKRAPSRFKVLSACDVP